MTKSGFWDLFLLFHALTVRGSAEVDYSCVGLKDLIPLERSWMRPPQ